MEPVSLRFVRSIMVPYVSTKREKFRGILVSSFVFLYAGDVLGTCFMMAENLNTKDATYRAKYLGQ